MTDRRSENRIVIRWVLALSVAALFISVSTSIAVLLFMIGYGQELAKRDSDIARLEGMVQARLQMESTLRLEIQTWQAYVKSLERVLTEHEIELPEAPYKRKGGK